VPTRLTDAPEELTLVARAKKIIAGEMTPEPLPLHDFVRRFVEESPQPEAVSLRQASESAKQEIIDHLNLQAHYSGQPTACLVAEGPLIVLAVGEAEIRELFAGLTRQEQTKVVIEYP
jgi:hypothetical protein